MRRLLVFCLCLTMAACSSNDSANNAMNVDENLVAEDSVEMNASTEMNATEMNAVDMNATDSNAAAPPLANATENAPAPIPPAPPPATPIEKGVGAFLEPPPMYVGRWYTVAFVVAPKAGTAGDQSPGTLAGEAQGKATTAPTTVFLAARMRVRLTTDPDFKIVLKTPEEQPTGLDKSATWQWSVSPLSAGEYELSAEVEPLDAAGNVVESYTRYVKVHAKARLGQRIKEGAEGATTVGDVLSKLLRSWEAAVLALAALLVAVFYLLKVIRNRGAKAAARDDAEDDSGEEKHGD